MCVFKPAPASHETSAFETITYTSRAHIAGTHSRHTSTQTHTHKHSRIAAHAFDKRGDESDSDNVCRAAKPTFTCSHHTQALLTHLRERNYVCACGMRARIVCVALRVQVWPLSLVASARAPARLITSFRRTRARFATIN